MIWPFKKREVMSLAQFAATKPMPPCGNPEEHWNWELNHYPCPACAGMELRKQRDADENRMAEKIAAAVVRKMKEPA